MCGPLRGATTSTTHVPAVAIAAFAFGTSTPATAPTFFKAIPGAWHAWNGATTNRTCSCAEDGEIRIWDIQTGKLERLLQVNDTPLYCARWNEDESRILASGDDGDVLVFDVQTQQCLRVLRGHTEYAVTLAWVPHTPYALSGSNDGSVRVWDTETSRCIKTLEGHKGDVRSVEWNEHGHCALSGDSKGLIRRWSLPDLSTDPR